MGDHRAYQMDMKRQVKRLTGLLLAMLTAASAACARTDPANLSDGPFSIYPEAEADLALPFNAAYRLFGGSDTEHSLVYRFGNEPTYFEWMAQKLAWTDDAAYLNELKEKLLTFPQTDNGYLWSWSTSVYWPTGRGGMHYDGTLRFVSAVAEILRWTGDLAFLDEKDTTSFGEDKATDASEGRTVYEKCAAAMTFAANEMQGDTGLITLTQKAALLADGETRFDKNEAGELLWNNTGRPGSEGSNYWDNLCFGHTDAYETALYYRALLGMADIERMRGNETDAVAYTQKAAKVKAAFNETFWDAEKGRYIACVDADGVRRDPGLTFLNTEALAYGLGDETKAERIFSWLDGERAVAGDTVTGSAIYDYAPLVDRFAEKRKLKKATPFVPVSNTVAIEEMTPGEPYWWFSLEGAITVAPGGNAVYGTHLENGGYIFYTLWSELTARALYRGADDVKRRASELAAVYRYNGFDSDLGGWAEGLTGEFPENGIVSRVFVSALAGLEAKADALEIRPNLPGGVEKLTVKRLCYRGVAMEAQTGAASLTLTAAEPIKGTLRFCPAEAGAYTALLTDKNGGARTLALQTDGGALTLDMTAADAVKIEISKG